MKARFPKLTDESIESMNQSLDGLSSKLQSVYGYPKERAEQESAGFRSSLPKQSEENKKQTYPANPGSDDTKPMGDSKQFDGKQFDGKQYDGKQSDKKQDNKPFDNKQEEIA